jgi:hypothetical protein
MRAPGRLSEPPQLEPAREAGLLESLLRRVPNLQLQDARGRDTDSVRRSWRILLRPLERLGIWRRRTHVEVTLLWDAEFQIMLSELRYPPIGIPTHVARDARPSRRTPVPRPVRGRTSGPPQPLRACESTSCPRSSPQKKLTIVNPTELGSLSACLNGRATRGYLA